MIPWLAIRTALGGAWGFISKLPATTIIIAVLCALSAFLWHNASGWKARDAKHVAAWRSERDALVVTTRSVGVLQRAIDQQNAAIEAQRKAGLASQALALAASDKARAASVSSLALADRLQRGAGKAAACVTPPEIMEANGL